MRYVTSPRVLSLLFLFLYLFILTIHAPKLLK